MSVPLVMKVIEQKGFFNLFSFYKLSILFLFLDSMYPWPSWELGSPVFIIIPCLLSFFVFIKRKDFFEPLNRNFSTIVLLVLLNLWSFRVLKLGGVLIYISVLIPSMVLACLKKELKVNILNFILKWFSIIVAVSLVVYILVLLGFNFPYERIQYENYSYAHDNYYFLLRQHGSFRFNSIFLEPGHLTMGLAPMLFIYRYNLKNKYVAVLFLAQLFTISLAGIVIMMIGTFLWMISNLRNGNYVRNFVLLLLIIGTTFYIIMQLYNDSDILNRAVIERVLNVGEGVTGRDGPDAENALKRISDTGEIWLGKPELRDQIMGAGYTKYIVLNGILGFSLMCLFYLSYFFIYKRKEVFFLSIICLLLMLQNAYPLWACMLINYILGVACLFDNRVLKLK